jgi:hypothetical protein
LGFLIFLTGLEFRQDALGPRAGKSLSSDQQNPEFHDCAQAPDHRGPGDTQCGGREDHRPTKPTGFGRTFSGRDHGATSTGMTFGVSATAFDAVTDPFVFDLHGELAMRT